MTAERPPIPQVNAAQIRKMEWGRKAIGLDLTTGRDYGSPIVWPVQTGGWVTQDGPANGEACGVGLHAALTVEGLSSVHRLAEAIVLPVGWLPDDVLGSNDHKVRVRRLYVLPSPMSFPVLLHDGWGRDADLTGANLSGADLSGADLSWADLTGADLYGATLPGATLYGANLYGADLTGADLTGADLTGANLSDADLRRADLTYADLSRATLTGVNLIGATLSGAHLYDADLTGANLTGADLTGANPTGADLTGVNLRRANLYGAYLTDADLYGAVADRWTRWPDGFDPAAAGVIVR